MNIFVTNEDPVLAARDLCDQHCRSKMQIESAIMLAHAFDQEVLNHKDTPRTKTGKPRKSGRGYYNHQCSVWVRESLSNFNWLVEHALEMFDERMYRWSGSQEHFTKEFIIWCKHNAHNTTLTEKGLTEFAIAININSECYQHPHFKDFSTVGKYRAYIAVDKKFATWTKRGKPDWFNTILQSDRQQYASSQYQLEHRAA